MCSMLRVRCTARNSAGTARVKFEYEITVYCLLPCAANVIYCPIVAIHSRRAPAECTRTMAWENNATCVFTIHFDFMHVFARLRIEHSTGLSSSPAFACILRTYLCREIWITSNLDGTSFLGLLASESPVQRIHICSTELSIFFVRTDCSNINIF